TCHNFRFFCANGLFMRNGRVCEDCIGRLPLGGVAHGCYRDSRIYTLPLAAAEGFHRIRGTWSKKIDTYIALTTFGKRKVVECGLPSGKVFIKPNFLFRPPEPSSLFGDSIVFIGRLSREKGIETLLDAFAMVQRAAHKNITLRLVGDGPLRQEIERKIANERIRNVELTGRKGFSESMAILREARFMVMPTLCYEMFPLTTIEAFACGKAVIGSRRGAMEEIIEEGKTGLLFSPSDPRDLASKIGVMLEDEAFATEMGGNARAEFEAKYTAERNFEILMDIYRNVLNGRNMGK
ncbi:MAG TPA: glycosyltransferase family 4 protein, partial [Thermodesulfovibrionales bacterium]|nr:glycosyltransferase family 4 protein [Thermodesulfovibrionales bacterium]